MYSTIYMTRISHGLVQGFCNQISNREFVTTSGDATEIAQLESYCRADCVNVMYEQDTTDGVYTQRNLPLATRQNLYASQQ